VLLYIEHIMAKRTRRRTKLRRRTRKRTQRTIKKGRRTRKRTQRTQRKIKKGRRRNRRMIGGLLLSDVEHVSGIFYTDHFDTLYTGTNAVHVDIQQRNHKFDPNRLNVHPHKYVITAESDDFTYIVQFSFDKDFNLYIGIVDKNFTQGVHTKVGANDHPIDVNIMYAILSALTKLTDTKLGKSLLDSIKKNYFGYSDLF